MAASNTTKPATARHGEPASDVEQLGGQLDVENSHSASIARSETAMAAAMRAALARREVLR